MNIVERLVQKRTGRILSIQSHVVHGYVGNRACVFPLQLLGFDVDFVNSVQFSNHTEYKNGATGQRLSEKDLREIYDGLKVNQLTNYKWIITGYCGDPSFLHEISSVVMDARNLNPKLKFICDPVLGDDGAYYVPVELTEIYRTKILPQANILTPNCFELDQLSKVKVIDELSCLAAIDELHKLGPSLIVVTSGISSETNPDLIFYCYASEMLEDQTRKRYRFEVPRIRGSFVGAGDVFTSLLLAWLDEENHIARAIQNVLASMQALIRRTSIEAYASCSDPDIAQRELRLIESRLDLICPSDEIKYTEI